MKRVYNFSAGPAMLPTEVLERAQSEMLDWRGTGMSIMELGHRGAEFQKVAEEAEKNLRELMSIPANYRVLFLAGGASVHFAMIPLNFMSLNRKVDYVDTGIWSKKAIAEAERYADVKVVASLDEHHRIPESSTWGLRADAAYLHYTPNETIEGIEFHTIPKALGIPLVADMSSMILSKKIDVSAFACIYAGAQKNLGQAGISIAIIREDLLKEPVDKTPTLYSYKIQAENQSFYNTPPTYSWYILGLVLEWMKAKGGVPYFEEMNLRKSQKLYQYIDHHDNFYSNPVDPSCRSRMNIVFNLPSDELTASFLKEAGSQGLSNLKGHRLAGGVRASIYNAMPEAGVDALLNLMEDFYKKNK